MAYQTAYAWKNENDYLLKEGLAGKSHYSMRYEDLVERPEQSLKQIFQFCELSWSKSTSAFLANLMRNKKKQAHGRSIFKKFSTVKLKSKELSDSQNLDIESAVEDSIAFKKFYL